MNINDERYLSIFAIVANTSLFMAHLMFAIIFGFLGVTLMLYYNIASFVLFLGLFILIYKKKYLAYTIICYYEIMIFMTFATICMGYDYGFHLYGLSLIAVAFYLYYLSSKDKTAKRFNPFISSIIIICFYILCIVVTNHMEPLYVLNKTVSSIFLGVNSFFVFSFVVFYMNEFLKLVFDSEKKLEHVAHHDNLTGLYNRSYMMDSMIGSLPDDKSDYWVAMADIDNFKKINDTYGHNGGDEVLMTVARTINDVCSKCIVCRWGGEEFLIIGNSKEENSDVLEKLRETIYKNEVVYHNQNIKVSVTIGVAEYDNDKNIDAWIQRADEKLYFGKENGKNRVVK